MRHGRSAALALAVALAAPHCAAAQSNDTKREVEQLRREVKELRQAVQALQEALKQQQQAKPVAASAPSAEEKQLEAELQAAMPAATPTAAPAVVAAQPAAGKSSSILNPNISFIGDFTFLGTDNRQLNKANEFSFREAEVGFQAPIDPFARADAFITIGEGESADVEEAYATFLTLPFNIQARAGKFRLAFGKNNTLHRHALPQTDRPFAEVVNFGDEGFSGTGVELSYLVPNPWDQYVLLTGEVVNSLQEAQGGSQGVPLDQPQPARALRDFAYLGHAQTFYDLNSDNNIELGASALINLPKSGTQTKIYGVDLTYRWRPLRQAGYHQFLWRTEGYFTDEQVRDGGSSGSAAFQPASFSLMDAAAPTSGDNNYNTDGFYTYGEYRLGQRWWIGTRADWTEVPAQRRQTWWGVYPYFTFAPTEFGYFRVGYQYAIQDELQNKESNRVWLQYDFSIGPHAAHPF